MITAKVRNAEKDANASAHYLNGLVERNDVTTSQLSVRINLHALLTTEEPLPPLHATSVVSFLKRQNGRAKPIVIAPPDAPQLAWLAPDIASAILEGRLGQLDCKDTTRLA